MKVGRKTFYDGVLDIPEGKSGKFEIRHLTIPAGEKVMMNTWRTKMMGQPGPHNLLYPVPTRWHQLLESGGGVWMSDFPIEQRQHDTLLAQVKKGTVLVGGLGLGYATTVLGRRPGLKVCVVEISKDVIDLVWPHLDPAVRSRATIVHANLFDFLENQTKPGRFDHGFYDIWQADNEGTFHTVVAPLRRLSRGKVRNVICWNEDVMRSQMRMGLTSRLLLLRHPEMFPGNPGLTQDEILSLWATPDTRKDNYWQNWSVPFWQRVQTDPNRDWTDEAALYAAMYPDVDQ